MIQQLTDIAVGIFRPVLSVSAESGGTFRILITARVNGEEKPLLLIGNAHSRIEDGHVIAVLNPDAAIVEKLIAGCAYSASLLKSEVAGKCDGMVHLWIDAYKNDGVSEISRYKAKTPKPPKFEIR